MPSKPGKQGRGQLLLLITPPLAVLSVFLVAPMIWLLRASFYTGEGFSERSGFTLAHYKHFLFDSYYLSVLGETLLFGVVTAGICALIGFPVGYSLARLPPTKRRWRMIVVVLPLTLSLVVVVFGWVAILGRTGIVNAIMVNTGLFDGPRTLLFNKTAVVVVLVQQTIPFMILSIMSVVSQIDPVLEQAAANLRANRFRTFVRIVIPMAAPGLLAGFVLVFVIAISAFITPMLVGGSRIRMIGSFIYEQMMTTMNWSFGAAMAFIILGAGLFCTALPNLLGSRRLGQGKRA